MDKSKATRVVLIGYTVEDSDDAPYECCLAADNLTDDEVVELVKWKSEQRYARIDGHVVATIPIAQFKDDIKDLDLIDAFIDPRDLVTFDSPIKLRMAGNALSNRIIAKLIPNMREWLKSLRQRHMTDLMKVSYIIKKRAFDFIVKTLKESE